MPDLSAYFERIAYAGSRAPTLETLRTLHLLHTQTIAFENLNPLLGWPVRLDIQSLERKLVHERRGGWCFEHNGLFLHVLERLGFRARGLAARVLWGAAEGHIGPRSHMVLHVDLEGEPWIADVGFGGLTLTGPLRLVPDIEQPTPHELFRLRELAPAEYAVEANLEGWKPLYRFGLEAQFVPDYEVSNWYLCHHPDSFFRRELLAARPFAGGRYALRNNQLSVHRLGKETEKRILRSAEDLRSILAHEFQIALPEGPELDVALERMAGGSP